MNASVLVAGFCVIAHLLLLDGTVLKGLNQCPRLSWQLLSLASNIHTHAWKVLTHTVATYSSFALSSKSSMAIWPNK